MLACVCFDPESNSHLLILTNRQIDWPWPIRFVAFKDIFARVKLAPVQILKFIQMLEKIIIFIEMTPIRLFIVTSLKLSSTFGFLTEFFPDTSFCNESEYSLKFWFRNSSLISKKTRKLLMSWHRQYFKRFMFSFEIKWFVTKIYEKKNPFCLQSELKVKILVFNHQFKMFFFFFASSKNRKTAYDFQQIAEIQMMLSFFILL